MGEILALLRERGAVSKVDLAELLVLGGEEKLRRIEADRADAARRRELRSRLIERARTGEGIDPDAAFEVRDSGWVHG